MKYVVASEISYSAAHLPTVFPVPFCFEQLEVTIRRVVHGRRIKRKATGYTVTGAGNPTGGEVIFNKPPPDNSTVVIKRREPT